MVDDLEERLSRYRADLDAAVAADLARRHLANREAGFHDEDPLLLDTEPEQLVPVKGIGDGELACKRDSVTPERR